MDYKEKVIALLNDQELSKEQKEKLENIFPELQENKDERIRKTIYGWIYTQPSEFFDNGFSKEEMLAWLEKQGENKSVDKPKFKVGDWIIFNGAILHIDEVINGYYRTTSKGDGIHNSYDWNIDNAARLWTIAEAKDGDVLDCEGCEYLLFKSFSNTDGRIKLYCWYNVHKNNFHDRGTDSKLRQEANIHPATKEQRELLFSKMKEAGYEWDAQKKELKKLSQRNLI